MGSARVRRPVRIAGVILSLLVAAAPDAAAADLWTETGRSLTSVNYWQGITFAPASGAFFFDGPATGLWRTDAALRRTAGRSSGIPSSVTSAEGWNHLGDLSFDAAGGGRLLVPLECYSPSPGPEHLQDRRVRRRRSRDPGMALLRQARPPRSPRRCGSRSRPTAAGRGPRPAPTSSPTTPADLRRDAGPAGAPLIASKRIAGVLRAPGVSGAAFLGDRLYLA